DSSAISGLLKSSYTATCKLIVRHPSEPGQSRETGLKTSCRIRLQLKILPVLARTVPVGANSLRNRTMSLVSCHGFSGLTFPDLVEQSLAIAPAFEIVHELIDQRLLPADEIARHVSRH